MPRSTVYADVNRSSRVDLRARALVNAQIVQVDFQVTGNATTQDLARILSHAIFAFMSSPTLASEKEILAACEEAIRLAPAEFPPTLPPSKEHSGAPEWYSFEHAAWPIGENIRRAFVENPRLKKDDAVLARVAGVVTYRNLRRGRQSFVMALGFVAARRYADIVAPFLNDPDVDGQVLDTLIKVKAPGYTREAISLLHSDKVWIRRLAKKYVDRYSKF